MSYNKTEKSLGFYQEPALEVPREIKKLISALLHNAVLDLTREPNLSNWTERNSISMMKSYNKAKEQARHWFLSDAKQETLHYPFLQVCEILNLNPTYIRRKLNLIEGEQTDFKPGRTRRR